jgi:uncharacterized protein (TIGR02466 family)
MSKNSKPTKQYFATSIYHTDLYPKNKASKVNKQLIEEVQILKSKDSAGIKWCHKNYPGGYTSYHSIPNLHQRSSNFLELEKKIRTHVYKFASLLDLDLLDRPLVMSDFWVNIMPKSVTHGLHLHPLSVISGTYYVDTPKGCSAIKFEDPRLGFFMASPPKKTNPSKSYFVEYPAEAGKLILFESWLRHEVPPNLADKDRISVSFNYAWA